jgi:hypothetical protein
MIPRDTEPKEHALLEMTRANVYPSWPVTKTRTMTTRSILAEGPL